MLAHIILDNYATHEHPKVINWLGRHPRFMFHFTSPSASELNAVEGFFTQRRLKRSMVRSDTSSISRSLSSASSPSITNSEDQYRLLEPLIPPPKPGGRPRTTDLRRLLDGLFYVVRTGCQ